jgi:hypothetical protein
MDFPASWLDKHSLVKPQIDSTHTDNGVYFTSVAVLLGFHIPAYRIKVRSCFIVPGLMARWPENNYDNCAWDDYLGVAAACIKLKEVKIPCEILRYGLLHLGFYNTDGKLTKDDFLWRNFPIWPLMFAAAFPRLKFLAYPFLYLVSRFFKSPEELIRVNDTSGFQLQWVFLEGCDLLGYRFGGHAEHFYLLSRAFKIYYHSEHPFNN